MKRGLLRDNCLVIYTTWRRVANKITQKVLGGLLFIIIFFTVKSSYFPIVFRFYIVSNKPYFLCAVHGNFYLFIYLFNTLLLNIQFILHRLTKGAIQLREKNNTNWIKEKKKKKKIKRENKLWDIKWKVLKNGWVIINNYSPKWR